MPYPDCLKSSDVLRKVVLVLAWLLATGCGSELADIRESEFTGATMGTTYSVKAVGLTENDGGAEIKVGVAQVLETVNRRMSTYDENSEVSRLNNHGSGTWMNVSNDLLSVMEEALRISKLSRGAFDVTVGPLVNLWGFGPSGGRERAPEEEAIRQALGSVGYQRIRVRSSPPGIMKESPNIYVDVSAIAKGYAVDRVADYLETQGIHRYLVEVGGELRAKGRNARGVPWRIAIEKPVTGHRTIHTVVEIAGNAVATSGDYRNYFEENGKRFSHTIDPRTGRPVGHKLASVTVIHPSAMRADALATALMVLGPEEGYALAEREQLAALFLIKGPGDFLADPSPGFERYMVH